MAEKMSAEQWREFVSVGTRTGKLATVNADGSPHVVPIWFVLDRNDPGGDDVVFTTWHASVKGRNLARDARAALSVDDQAPPYSYVMLRGRVTLSEDIDDLRTWATRLGSRYMGPEQGPAFGARNAVPGELLVRLHIEHVVAEAAVSA